MSYTPEQAKALASVAERRERSARDPSKAVRAVGEPPRRIGSRTAARFNRIGLSADIPKLRDNPARAAQFDP
ncbi:hypothetical protein HLY00_3608 [Mycolicibacterium hippocampi]|uniref:Uncharacterized protein n=1 Tax=Mycolicibacterium hippocampi TaxID=659824 RepID=A0A850PUL6_9MYCO|nr:hypothetical protein [Mycolicibacterium hippocampi]